MTERGIFSGRVLVSLVAAVIVVFTASLLLTAHGDPTDKSPNSINRIGPNSFSHSAVGHLAFYEMMRRLDIPVTRSQFDSVSKLDRQSVLVLAEPGLDASSVTFRGLGVPPRTVLLVLPKFRPLPDAKRKDWMGGAELLSETTVEAVLAEFANASRGLLQSGLAGKAPKAGDASIKGEVVRVSAPGVFPATWQAHRPTYSGTVQLLKNSTLTPLIASGEGVVLGEMRIGENRLLVLSDPEVIENHAISDADNAAFAADLVSAARGKDGTVVLDETIHGFHRPPPNLLDLVLGFPYNLLIGQALLAVLLLLWSANHRFSVPQPVPAPRQAGKAALITNAALLMDFGGHHRLMLGRYLQLTVLDAAQRLRAPGGLQGGKLVDWLDRVGKGQARSCSAILAETERIDEADLHRLFDSAKAIQLWKRDILDGSIRRSRDH